MRAVDGAAERIKNEQLDPLADFHRDGIVGETGDEFGDPTRVDVIDFGVVAHLVSCGLSLSTGRLRWLEPGCLE